MKSRDNLAVVDPNLRRRAALCFAFGQDRRHAEPHESVEELLAAPSRPDTIVVLDQGDLVARISEVALRWPGVRIVAYAETLDPQRIVRAARAGAIAYLQWPFDLAELGAALADQAGEDALPGAAPRGGPLHPLTPREREILSAAASGMSSRVISQHLAISRRTVDAHRVNVMNKMGVRSIAEAVAMARSAGMLAAAG